MAAAVSGKRSIVLVYASLGYQVFYMTRASGANICEYPETIEDGQGTIAEHEPNNLDKDDYKKLIKLTFSSKSNEWFTPRHIFDN